MTKNKTDAKIISSSSLPRLVDFKLSERNLNQVNSELRRLCRISLLFCNLYRSFLHNNKPDPFFYAPKVIQKENYLYYQTSQFIDCFKFY